MVFCNVEQSIIDRVRVITFAYEAKDSLLCFVAAFASQAINVLAKFQCVGANSDQFYDAPVCRFAVPGG